jgi:hypothetical protein
MEEKVKFRWDEQRVKDNELFQAILNDASLREKLFTEKFIEGLEKRRDALNAHARNVNVAQLTMLLLLLVAIAFPNMSVSALGLSAKAANFRELLLFVIASLQIHLMPPSIEQARITDLMDVYVQVQSEGNPTVLRALRLRYGIATGATVPDLVGRRLSRRQTIFVMIGGLSMLLWIFGIFVVFFLLQLVGMISILIHPTLSIWPSILVCLYIVVVIAMDLGVRAMTGFATNIIGRLDKG